MTKKHESCHMSGGAKRRRSKRVKASASAKPKARKSVKRSSRK